MRQQWRERQAASEARRPSFADTIFDLCREFSRGLTWNSPSSRRRIAIQARMWALTARSTSSERRFRTYAPILGVGYRAGRCPKSEPCRSAPYMNTRRLSPRRLRIRTPPAPEMPSIRQLFAYGPRAAPDRAPSEQVDAGGQRHRERHRGVPVIALEHENHYGDQTRQDGPEPGQSSQVHELILVFGPDGRVRDSGVRAADFVDCGWRRAQIPKK